MITIFSGKYSLHELSACQTQIAHLNVVINIRIIMNGIGEHPSQCVLVSSDFKTMVYMVFVEVYKHHLIQATISVSYFFRRQPCESSEVPQGSTIILAEFW